MSRSLLIVIPTYNERENIVGLIDRIRELQPQADILVVDDSSPDGTADAVEEASARHGAYVRVLRRNGKGGRGSAVLEGFRMALEEGYPLVMEMDADFSHRPEEIGHFLEKIKEADMVSGSRYLPGSEIHHWGWKRTFFSKWANRYAKLILGIPMSDYTNGFRLYTAGAVQSLNRHHIDTKGYVVLSEVAYQLHRLGKKIAEVPTIFVNRRRGISNLGFHEIHEAFFSVLRIRSPKTALHMKQGLKFAICGGLGATIDLSTLTIQVELLGIPEGIAFLPSTAFAVTFVFLANKYFTFKNRERQYGSQMLKFIMVYGVAVASNLTISYVLLWLGVHYLLARISAIGVGAVWNYAMSHGFVFKKSEKVDAVVV
jgi:dolichol-phosphate mannosyltransferase